MRESHLQLVFVAVCVVVCSCSYCRTCLKSDAIALPHVKHVLPDIKLNHILYVGVSRLPAVSAKYGDKSVYFDLEDIGNTTGNWDLYGSDAPSPYNGLQSKFFETFGGAFTKRGLLLKFLLLGGGGTIAYLSSSASADLLPIKKGPLEPPKPGPRGKI